MGDHRLPKRVMSGEMENTGKREPGGGEKKWMDCMAEDRWIFGMAGDWSTATTLDPGVWYSTVQYAKAAVGLWSRVDEGRGRGVRKPAEESSGDRTT